VKLKKEEVCEMPKKCGVFYKSQTKCLAEKKKYRVSIFSYIDKFDREYSDWVAALELE